MTVLFSEGSTTPAEAVEDRSLNDRMTSECHYLLQCSIAVSEQIIFFEAADALCNYDGA